MPKKTVHFYPPMSLSAQQIGKILREIEIPLKGGFLRRIDQSQKDRIRLEIHNQGKRYRLLIAANPQHARCHLVTKKDPSPATPPQFCQLLRSHLRYKQIISTEQLNEDRMIQFRFGWNGKPDRTLLAELTGVNSNLFLLDGKGFVIGSLFSPRKNRPLSPGKRYAPPEFHKQAAYKETVIPTRNADPFQFNLDVEDFYTVLEKKEEREKDKKTLLSTINAAIKKKQQQLKRRLNELCIAEKSEDARTLGEMLKNNLYQITPGASQFKCLNEHVSTKEEMIIPLDPALSPSENMAHYFKKYKKGLSAQSNLKKIIIKTREERVQLERDLELASSVDLLTEDPLPVFHRSNKNKPVQRGQKEAKKSPPVYLSMDDMMLIIGRNDRENEEVTFRLAKGNDYWFHARGVPGAHLLVRMMRKKELPYQTLLDAATLALYFSQHKKSGRGEILYTYKKYVQRVKKGRPGSVICSQEKTLYLELDETRLSRILESRVFNDSSETTRMK